MACDIIVCPTYKFKYTCYLCIYADIIWRSTRKKRQVTGLARASMGSCIKRINKLRYKVKSQSDAWKWYEVVKQYGHNIGGHEEGEWRCPCRILHTDISFASTFMAFVYKRGCGAKSFRKKSRHLSLRNPFHYSVYVKNVKLKGRLSSTVFDITKMVICERYQCTNWNRKFIINFGFDSKDGHCNLYFKGISLRKVCDDSTILWSKTKSCHNYQLDK